MPRHSFATMDKSLVIELAGKGGRSAHANGKAHKFNSESARAAALKLAEIRRAKKASAHTAQEVVEDSSLGHVQGREGVAE